MIIPNNPDLCMVFDFETLDTNPTGVILSMGVVAFNLGQVDEFDTLVSQGVEIMLDTAQQIRHGRTRCPSTLGWWQGQGEHAQRVLNADPRTQIDCSNLLHELSLFYQRIGIRPNPKETRWFSRGHFDATFLENFCRSFGMDPPYRYWCWRDARTYLDARGLGSSNQKLDKPPQMIAHNALHDAAFEAYMLQRLGRTVPAGGAP